MGFNRISSRLLPNGEFATVYPFHVCTEGQDDRIVFRDDEDLRVAHNFIPICARRTNVIVFADCVLNTHMHAGVLARSYQDAWKFGNQYKMSASRFITEKYGGQPQVFREVDARPIPLEDNRHVRNAICYIARNSLDMGIRVEKYEWSSYRANFCRGKMDDETRGVSELTAREVRKLLCTGNNLNDVPWRITKKGVIEPASYCDLKYVEEAFDNDISFFMKIMGLTDDQQMKQELETSHRKINSVAEILNSAEDRCQRMYGKSLSNLTLSQKIPVMKTIYLTMRTTPSQIARCFGVAREDVLEMLGNLI